MWDVGRASRSVVIKLPYRANVQNVKKNERGGGETPLWVWEFSLHNTAFLQYLIQMITSTITKMFIFI